MVSSMVGGWGCPGRWCRRGALALGCPRLLGIPWYGVSGGWRLGGVVRPGFGTPSAQRVASPAGPSAREDRSERGARAPRGVTRGGSGLLFKTAC